MTAIIRRLLLIHILGLQDVIVVWNLFFTLLHKAGRQLIRFINIQQR